ncbi:MAG: DUF4058 family protein [Gemmataceae bacterium]|nr:DUF4058 family protein [Gemmataceae bacterium]
MPLHDWSKMSAGHFHAFHTSWLIHMAEFLNDGVLPDGFHALPEQHTEGFITDVTTYEVDPIPTRKKTKVGGGIALAEPKSERRVIAKKVVYPGRHIAIRYAEAPRIVAVIELVSNSNKDRRETVGEFAGKVADYLRMGVHVLVVDILPPSRSTPNGMHAAIWRSLDRDATVESPPEDRPFLIASYRAERKPIAYINSIAVDQKLPQGPIYIDSTRYVELPLEASYMETFRRLPKFLKTKLEPR